MHAQTLDEQDTSSTPTIIKSDEASWFGESGSGELMDRREYTDGVETGLNGGAVFVMALTTYLPSVKKKIFLYICLT